MLQIVLAAIIVNASAAQQASLNYEAFASFYTRLMNGETTAQLEDTVPGLRRNLKTASRVSADYWTDCTPYDELAKEDILPVRVLEALGIRRTVDGGVAHVPAGVMHTYGYLFSQLKTAYGLKGKRWIESRLDERLGLPAGTFSPYTLRGEFASNVTSALLQLAGEKPKLARAARLRPSAKVLGRIEQNVTWRAPDGQEISAVVVTRLVELRPLEGFERSDVALLIYEVVRDRRRRLVTAFPVGRGFADDLSASKPSEEAAFKPRFNLYVDPSWTVGAQKNSGFLLAAGRDD